MYRRTLILLCSLLVSALCITPATAQAFVRPDLGIGFLVPERWRQLPAQPGIPFIALAPDNGQFTPKVALSVQKASGPLSADQGIQLTNRMKRNYPGYQVVSKGRFLMAGSEAVMISGVFPAPESAGVEGLQLRNCLVYTVHGGRAYTFVYLCDKENYQTELPAFVEMVDSVKWNPRGRPTTTKAQLQPATVPSVAAEGTLDEVAVKLPAAKIAFIKPQGFQRVKFKDTPLEGGETLYTAGFPTENNGITFFLVARGPAPASEFPEDLSPLVDALVTRAFEDAKILKIQRGNIGGTNSVTMLFEHKPREYANLVRAKYVALLKGSQLYTFLFMADKDRFEEDDSSFNKILSSIRWL